MLDIKLIQKEIDQVITKLKNRNVDERLLKGLSHLVQQRNLLLVELNQANEQKNIISRTLANAIDKKKLLIQAQTIKKIIHDLETRIKTFQDELDLVLPTIPNLPLDQVPAGDETNNQVILQKINLGPGLITNVKPHYEIALEKNLIDFTRAAKLSGARFVCYKNEGALLMRALQNFMLDVQLKQGYQELIPPFLVSSAALYGTAQLPKFASDSFKIDQQDLWLIPTAEVPLVNYFQNEILDLNQPIKLTAYSPCFRSEAGSSGKDTKGLIRMHQFHKVELVKITNRANAFDEFELCLSDAERILELLKIPYQRVLLAAGDMGFSAQMTYDLELWLPSEQKFREVSSVSYCGDFQARRAMIRYRNEMGKTEYAHTINGSGLAIDRVFAALLELGQKPDGTVVFPEVLWPYTKGIKKI